MAKENPKHPVETAGTPSVCPNCGGSLQSTYCSVCGQNNRMSRLSIKSVFGPLVEELTEFELPIVRTVLGLTIRPGGVCRDFVEGKRKRYTNPVKYCFLTGALFVLVIQLFDLHPDTGLQRQLEGTMFYVQAPDSGDPSQATNAFAIEIRNFVEQWLQVVNLLLIPMLVPLLMVMYPKAKLNFAEHSVFLLFLFGHIFLLGIPMLLVGLYDHFWTWIAMQVWPLIYMTWAACVFYPGHWLVHSLKMFTLIIGKTVISAFVGGAMAIGFALYKVMLG